MASNQPINIISENAMLAYTPKESIEMHTDAVDHTIIEPEGLQPEKIQIYDSIEEFEKNLPSTVTILQCPTNGNKVYLVGTAHFSAESCNDVSLVIRNVLPDSVVVELCSSRVHILKHDEATLLAEAKDISIAKIRNVIRTNGVINGVFFILLLNMSAKLTKELGMAPGGEFRRALAEASKIPNCNVHLGDRPINITLQRAIKGLSLWQTLKLVYRLCSFDEDISKEEVEQCKQRDLLEELMKEMSVEFPAFEQVFVKERDLFLCHSLQSACNYNNYPGFPFASRKPLNVVGVVGIGHCSGITKNWGKVDSTQIPKILMIPPVSFSTKAFKFTLKYGTLTGVCYLVFKLAKPHVQKIF